jgi:phage terminase large subunit-like protein
VVIPVTPVFTAKQYIDDVSSGRQVACKWVKLAVERHMKDIERAEANDPDFPFYFDEDEAKRAIEFQQQLKHTKGEWADPRLHDTHIHLEPWQQFIDWNIFGWRRKATGYRRFTKVYIEVGRKNGKTTKAAATGNYCWLADSPREIGPEAYFVATKKDQAKIAWAEAERQQRRHPYLKTKVRTYRQNSTIVIPGTAAMMRPIGKDSKTEDALNPHYICVDEFHAHRTIDMIEVMESALGARRQPLTYIITTAGLDKNSPCYQNEHTQIEHVLERTVEPVPEHLFGIIYTLDEEDDWTDPDVWVKANPNLGVSVSREYLESRILDAQQIPSKQNQIITKNLNIWTQAETRWISDDLWLQCDYPVVEDHLLGRRCFGGLDLSASRDITAWVLCFPPERENEPYQFLYRFFMPEDNMLDKERRDLVPYTHWADQGLIYPTPGISIDYDFVEQQIINDSQDFRIEEIGYDPWKAQEIINHLISRFVMVEINQRYNPMGKYTDTFEKKLLSREIAHGGNPIMRWMIACTEVKSDRQGNIMPMKPRRETSGKRIDGVVASIISIGRAVEDDADSGEFDVGAVYGQSS